jgi:putative chitinase
VDYWQHRVPQNAREDVIAATRAVNGGLNGLEDRAEKFEHYQRKLTPKYLEQLKNELSPAIQPNPFANPDNFGALEIPSLSPVAQTIKQQCYSHVHGFCERNNQPWTEGMDNTVMSLTVVAREAQMSGVDWLGVSRDNTIHIEQVDRKGIYREAQISAHEAANIPVVQSEQRLAIVDQQMLAQEQQQTINNLAQTQHKVHSGPRMS